MRKWCLTAGVLLLSSAWMIAQSGSTAPPSQDDQQRSQPSTSQQQPDASQTKEPSGANHGGHTLEGCITSVAGGYTLTDNSGKTYQLTGDTSKLANEVGHYDQVTGTEESHGAGAAAGGAAGAGASGTFTVRKIKMISTTCPNK